MRRTCCSRRKAGRPAWAGRSATRPSPRGIRASCTAPSPRSAAPAELSWLPPYDGVVEARSGANVDLGVTLDRETPAYRARPNPSYGAANIAVQSIAAALLVRERDGRGQHIDTSLYQGLLAYDFSSALRRQNDLGELDPPLPATARRVGPFLPYLAVRCQDGQWMQITNNTARLFRHWMEVIGLAHILDDPRWKGAPSDIPDLEAKVELAYLILDRMGTRTFDEWLDIFLREGLTGDRFLTTQQALDHPQVIHNGSVIELDDPEVGPDPAARPHDQVRGQPGCRPNRRAAARRGPGRVARHATAPSAASRATPANGQAAAGRTRPAGRDARPGLRHLAGRPVRHLAAGRHGRTRHQGRVTGGRRRPAWPRRPRPHLPGQGKPGHRPEERGGPRGRAAAGRPGRRGDAQHARRRRRPSRHRLRDRQGTEPRHHVPVRRLLRVDRAGRRAGRVPPDDGRAQRRRPAAAGSRERAARRRCPAGRGGPLRVLASG